MNANEKAAASKPAESIPGPSDAPSVPHTRIPGQRRNIYITHPLSAIEVDQHGEPPPRYALNKVRTSSTSSTPCQSSLPKSLLISRRVHTLDIPAEEPP
jgi:hypothetical protein